MSLSTTIKSIQDVMRTDVGVDGDAQRIGQLTWMLFLKIWDDREQELELIDQRYVSPLVDVVWYDGGQRRVSADLRWRAWAADPEGLTGDRLLDYTEHTLFPALKTMEIGRPDGTERSAIGLSSRRALIRSVFEDAYQYMKSGTLLRQVVNRIHADIDLNDARNRHLFGEIYEQMLKDLQGAGTSGEYYTPRAVTEFAVRVTRPRLGEIVMDPACGTGGFLAGAVSFVRANDVRTTDDEEVLQRSIRGVEKKPLPHLLCVTNMIVHGIDVPSGIVHTNALARPLREISDRDRVDVILTNPPFRGMEEPGIENNFPLEVRTRETADLFLSLVLEQLRPGGRAAIVLPDSSLFSDGIKETLRRRLLAECDLHTILRLPHGVFSPYTDIRTNLLFFVKGGSTSRTWFYELPCPYGEKYTKTKPIMLEDLRGAESWWEDRREGQWAWQVESSDVARNGWRLDIDNPRQEDLVAALLRHEQAQRSLGSGLDEARAALRQATEAEAWPVGPRARDLLLRISELAPVARMSSGVVETLRRALTDLALRGELSEGLDADEPVGATLARYARSSRRVAASGQPPYAIPDRWAWARLAEVCEFRIGRTPPTKDDRFWNPADHEGGIPWVAIGDMPRRGVVETTERTVTPAAVDAVFKGPPVAAGSLLVAFKLSVGKTALLGVDAYHNEAIASLRADDDALRSFLVWAVPALVTHAALNPAVRGATLNSKSIAELWLPIPPREEQGRIVGALAWASDLIESVADAAEALRDESDVLVRLLGTGRVLSAST